VTSVKIGNVEVVSFLDLSFAFPYNAAFAPVPADAWEAYKSVYPECWNEQGNWQTYSQAFLLRSDGQNILVDTGFGPGPHGMLGGATGNLVGDMQAKGVRPEEVNVVVLTHLHFDHTGWAARDGQPVFANARYLFPEADWNAFSQDLSANAHVGLLVPLKDAGKVELTSGEKTLTPELTIVPTPGHTPGHQSVVIASTGDRGIILGDVFNHPAQANETEWNASFDGDPATAAATRKRMMERLESEGGIVASGHYRPPGLGRIVRDNGRRVFRAL
jgi:glyoxylase-like metal-dependent hydrolase (beta-lactamase superfamily II)